ncbi:GNAT family N-acetyltransferase [Kribbella sp. NPDC051770]|uniref:GNAT family N-acetyltransferase n=1 Tax=Kribbella sp. NPDC051770 TaxID=3155413 RepID=UPI0034205603
MDDLLRRWQYGWGLCRGLEPAADRSTALDVTLNLPHRDREFFVRPDADPAPWIDEARNAARPTWLTVTTNTPDEAAAELTDGGLTLFPERRLLMTIELRAHPVPTHRHTVLKSTEGPLERVRIPGWQEDAASGDRNETPTTEAARGMAAITNLDAVMHDIHTDPAYRRQGLGSIVMGALAERARERGATTGLLMATVDGAALYRRLGWVPQATMLTATAA